MNIEYSHFWLPKAGNLASTCEDAFYPYNFPFDIVFHDQKYQRFAIADGASTAYLSGLWATVLVDGFGSYDEDITNEKFLDLIRTLIIDENWNPRLSDYIKKRETEGKPLSWYDEMALQQGAASSLLEISFSLEEGKIKDKFSALAVGDSCMFQVRENEIITKFPLSSSSDFDNSPLLISSDPNRNEHLLEKISYLEDQDLKSNDKILLMTDALSSWFFQECEKGNNPEEIISEHISDKKRFEIWIDELRENKLIRNDDVTLLILTIRGDC